MELNIQQKNKTSIRKRSRYWHFSAMEIIYWATIASSTYLTVYLKEVGFTPTKIGTIAALNSAMGIVATPLFGIMADKVRSSKKIFLFCMCVGAILWALIPVNVLLKSWQLFLFILVPASHFFRTPAGQLLDTWVVQSANREKLNYGAIRMWGSLSLGVVTLLLSLLLEKTSLNWAFYILPIMIVPMLFFSKKLGDTSHPPIKSKRTNIRKLKIGSLFKNYYYITFILFAITLYIPMQTGHVYLPYLVTHVGGNAAQVGLLTGFKTLIEIPTLLLVQRLRDKKIPFWAMLLASGLFYIAEMLLYTRATAFYQLVLISVLYGAASGFSIGASSNYIYTLAPTRLKATAQTINGAVTSIAGIIGSIIGGRLLEQVGIIEYYKYTGFMMIGAVAFFVLTLWFGKRVLKKENTLAIMDRR